MKSFTCITLLVAIGVVMLSTLVASHSQMRCAKWNPDTGDCAAHIRNEGQSLLEESYRFDGGSQPCQIPWVNPITSYYNNGPSCPDWAECSGGMGTYAPGETFTVMWWARNHATADQTPGTVEIYLSPLDTANQQADYSISTFKQNQICQGPYINCNGQNGNTVNCSLTCTMPNNLAAGTYTMLWYWFFQVDTFTTCADIMISNSGSGSNSNGGGSTSTSTTGKKASSTSTTTTTTTTTGKQSTSTSTTSGKQSTSTTTTSGKQSTSSSTSTSTSTTTTGKASTSSTSSTGRPFAATTSPLGTTGLNKLCYLPGTPNPKGKINHSPASCGVNAPHARCADGQCCSKYGYCGPIPASDGRYYEVVNGVYQELSYLDDVKLYCANNTGDYRKYPCNQLPSDAIVASEDDYIDDASLASFAIRVEVVFVFSLFLIVLMI